jgi:hypothetical protein
MCARIENWVLLESVKAGTEGTKTPDIEKESRKIPDRPGVLVLFLVSWVPS